MYTIDTGETYEQFVSTGRETENLWNYYMDMYGAGVEMWTKEIYEDNTFVALKIDSQEDLLDNLNFDIPLMFEEWQKNTVLSIASQYDIKLCYEKV